MVDVPLADAPAGVDPAAWAAACGAVRGHCEWHVAPSAQETVQPTGSGGLVLLLPTLHLTDLTDVINDGVPVTVDPKDWSEAGVVDNGTRWSRRRRGVTVTMTHGHETCPPEVLEVVTDLARSGGRVG